MDKILLTSIKPNLKHVEINGIVYCFSYETLVAFCTTNQRGNELFIINKHFSKTTTAHINLIKSTFAPDGYHGHVVTYLEEHIFYNLLEGLVDGKNEFC